VEVNDRDCLPSQVLEISQPAEGNTAEDEVMTLVPRQQRMTF